MTTQIPRSSGSRPWRRGAPWFISLVALHLSAAALPGAERYVEGELLVKFHGGPKGANAKRAQGWLKHQVKRDFDLIGWQHIRLPAGMKVEDGVQRFRNIPGVLVVEPNGFIQFSDATTPNDPMFSQQWALPKIGATNTWAVTTGSSNVVVAVIDTGVNYNHEDLAPNMWRNPGEIPGNGIDDDENGFVDDVYGINAASGSVPFDFGFINNSGTVIYHGSGCAGILGAAGHNNKGVTGVNWSVQIMAIRLNDHTNFVGISDVMSAFDYVTLMKRRGVNIRVTSNSYYSNPRGLFSQALKDAVDAAGSEGVLNVFVSANEATNIDVAPIYPAAFGSASILSVAASDQSDNLASFSNYGRTNVHLAAPGVGIRTASGASNSAYYIDFGGTSAACPYVAGSAALLFSAYPSATPLEVKAALLSSVDVLPAFTNRMVSHGRLNVGRALQRLGQQLTNAPPHITFQPQPQTVVLSNGFAFNVVVTGTQPWTFQWLLNGAAVGAATHPAYGYPAATESDAGDYVLVASNAFGIVTSAVARLTVLTTPVFVADPRDRGIPETSNVLFTALATGYLPQYHWHFFGTNLPGRNGTNLTLTNISTAMEGPYAVVASNAYGMTTSIVATLTVFTFPRMVEPASPLRIDAVAGERITFSVRTTGSLPMGYRWRRSGLGMVLTNMGLHENECVFTTTVTNSATWTVILTNVAQPNSTLQRTNAIITIVSDADGDGLPDNWESVYPEAADAAGDTDGDGMTNLEEYRAGTNPTNAISALRFASFARNGSALDLSFVAISNKSYAVEQRSLVHTGAWSGLFSVVAAGTTRLIEFAPTNDASSQQQYYRVRQR